MAEPVSQYFLVIGGVSVPCEAPPRFVRRSAKVRVQGDPQWGGDLEVLISNPDGIRLFSDWITMVQDARQKGQSTDHLRMADVKIQMGDFILFQLTSVIPKVVAVLPDMINVVLNYRKLKSPKRRSGEP